MKKFFSSLGNIIDPIPRSLPVITGLILVLLISVPIKSLAETASFQEMDRVCTNWLSYTVYQTGDWAGSIAPEIVDIQDIIENDTLLGRYYAIAPQGYIIVSALKNLSPVKVYSDQNRLDVYEADGFGLMIRQVLRDRLRAYVEVYGSLEAIAPAESQPLYGTVNRERWDDFTVSPKDFSASANKSLMEPTEGLGPLLTTSWHQGYPYNALCPMGDGGRCVVGCVATAMAQIMWYHQWPPSGDGTHSYTWNGDNSCGGSTPSATLSVDCSDPYIYVATNENLQEINYETGVSVNMDYGYCGSGAYFSPVVAAYVSYFKYDNSIQLRSRLGYSSEAWFNLVKDQINQYHPTLYGIYSHAIVCDGWRVQSGLNQYHMNYGWGGGNNAWYVLDNVYCPWDGCGLSAESMIFNIIPMNGDPWLGESELSDVTLGDGDGIPEAGETIDLTFYVANYGGAEITDVEVNLSVDDATIGIIDGNIYFGTIPARDSVVNTGDPLVFSIPMDYTPRIDSFLLEITWNGGTKIDTMFLEQDIGGVNILLVDDDNNGGVEFYYEEALNHFRIPSDIWVHSAYASPDSAYLDNYDIVMWFSGDYQSSPLNATEITAMEGFMNAGGFLFLTGQGIAAQLDTYDPVFMSDYLKSNYQSTLNIPVLSTESGGQVFDVGHMIAIQGGNSASNQEYPDLITPTGGGVAELLYLGQTDYGAVSYAGDYRTLFCGFGYEAVVSDDSRWRDRDSVMSDILNFFDYQNPNRCPEASGLTVSPGNAMNLVQHTPDFDWTYFDIEASPQTMYYIQVSEDADWQSAEMWDYGPISGSDTHITYAGAELIDGVKYYSRVRVYDGTFWSDWNDLDIRMNSVPSAPADMSPSEMQGVSSSAPELSHATADDAELDAITHSYEVYDDAAMTTLIDHAENQPSQYGTSSWTVNGPLTEDEDFYWRVRGSDPYEDGQWSELASFWVNSDNQLPAQFDLTAPEDGASHSGEELIFTWTSSTDADPYDQVRYTLQYSTDPAFATSTSISDLNTTTFTETNPFPDGNIYYWKVKAYDTFGGETESDNIFSFTTGLRGDANGDGLVDVGDVVFLIAYIFRGGPAPEPVSAGDANCDGSADVGDAVYLIAYIFKGGPPPGCD